LAIFVRIPADPLSGKDFLEICDQLSQGEMTVVIGLNERDGDALYNSAVVIEQGELVGRYRKSYLYKDYFSKGEEFPVFQKKGITYGVMICLDVNYLEPARILAIKGAQVIFSPMFNRVANGHPLLTTPSPYNHFTARAFENDLYLVTADIVWNDDGKDVCPGFSRIHDRNGTEIAKLKPFEEGFLIHEVQKRDLYPRKTRRIFGDPKLFDILSAEYEKYRQREIAGKHTDKSNEVVEQFRPAFDCIHGTGHW
jgi:predicted amidohydrolase